jgi:hypothetical protein
MLQLTAELTRPVVQLQDDAARWQSLGTGSLQSNLLSVQLLGSLPAGLSVKVGRMRPLQSVMFSLDRFDLWHAQLGRRA